MKKGGQSAPRFARIRDNEITLWYKRINEYLKGTEGEFHLGINSIYKNRFINKLSTYTKQRVLMINSCEGANLSGIYDQINRIENGKKDTIHRGTN